MVAPCFAFLHAWPQASHAHNASQHSMQFIQSPPRVSHPPTSAPVTEWSEIFSLQPPRIRCKITHTATPSPCLFLKLCGTATLDRSPCLIFHSFHRGSDDHGEGDYVTPGNYPTRSWSTVSILGPDHASRISRQRSFDLYFIFVINCQSVWILNVGGIREIFAF